MHMYTCRASFVVESVLDLKARLRSQLAADLLVLVGKPEEVIPGLIQGCQAPLVLSSHEVTSEELAVDAAVSGACFYVFDDVACCWCCARALGGMTWNFYSEVNSLMLSACMPVCMCVCVRACTHAHTRTRTHPPTHTHTYAPQLERAIKPLGAKHVRLWTNTLYHLDDLEVSVQQCSTDRLFSFLYQPKTCSTPKDAACTLHVCISFLMLLCIVCPSVPMLWKAMPQNPQFLSSLFLSCIQLWAPNGHHLQDPAGPLGARGVKGMPDGYTSFREKVCHCLCRVKMAMTLPIKFLKCFAMGTGTVFKPPCSCTCTL